MHELSDGNFNYQTVLSNSLSLLLSKMKPVKALIVEDNVFMATVLTDLLQQDELNISILGVAKTGREALYLIPTVKPDVVFLDIELPDMTGFELLKHLDTISFQTIFTTSHSHYAIKAFRLMHWIIWSNLLKRLN